jgi:soluble lytic murein transglycosylase-like protein
LDKTTQQLLLVLGAAGIAYWLYKQSSGAAPNGAPPPDDATSFVNDPIAAVSELVSPWKSAGSAADWLAALATTEQQYGMPTDLLARLAYQESRFRESIIRGTTVSSAGAIGMMQFLPSTLRQISPNANITPLFTDTDVLTQIGAAGLYLRTQWERFGSWPLALAAYNAGPGNVAKYGGIPPFAETQNYVAQISADVPGLA